jgi:hypothetical protein
MKIDELRAILLREWDPIDIGDNPKLSDEYDAYLPGLIKLMNSGCARTNIAGYLKNIESTLGLALPSERREKAAAALSQL